ncbi:MAG: zinc ribbon domain-containing protein [Elusimicrobia bacterium]|nr:zinc ribbon domain-containing protein [Elusimicrobiota bacterium]
MTLNEWKPKLIPPGMLLVCYFVAPGLVEGFMGTNDAISGRFTFSLIVKAGLGIVLVYKLFSLKPPLNGELTAWLAKFSQPPAKTQELSEKISLAAILISILIIVGPLAGEIITNSQLLTLIKITALVYAGYMAYNIWKLAEPFMAYVPAAAPPEIPPAPPVTERRCVKCGQRIDASMKFCAFCGHTTAGS